MIRTGDPVRDANTYYAEAEHRQKLYLRGCPWCVICDEQIADPKCYVIEPGDAFNSCICKECMNAELEKARKTMFPYLFERLLEFVEYDLEKVTPHDNYE